MPSIIGSPGRGKGTLLPTVLSTKTVAATTNENGVVQWPASGTTTNGETSASGAGSASEASGATVASASVKAEASFDAPMMQPPSASAEVDTGIVLKTPPK